MNFENVITQKLESVVVCVCVIGVLPEVRVAGQRHAHLRLAQAGEGRDGGAAARPGLWREIHSAGAGLQPGWLRTPL